MKKYQNRRKGTEKERNRGKGEKIEDKIEMEKRNRKGTQEKEIR